MKNKYYFFKNLYPDYLIIINNNKSIGIDKLLIKYLKNNDINYIKVNNEFKIIIKKCKINNYYQYVILESILSLINSF